MTAEHKSPMITDVQEVWVAWTNTDLTEGRGWQVPHVVCESRSTAVRLGSKGYVMGSDCPVEKALAVRVGNVWLVPGRIIKATDADKALDEKRRIRDEVLEKARGAGLTDDELKIIGGGR